MPVRKFVTVQYTSLHLQLCTVRARTAVQETTVQNSRACNALGDDAADLPDSGADYDVCAVGNTQVYFCLDRTALEASHSAETPDPKAL